MGNRWKLPAGNWCMMAFLEFALSTIFNAIHHSNPESSTEAITRICNDLGGDGDLRNTACRGRSCVTFSNVYHRHEVHPVTHGAGDKLRMCLGAALAAQRALLRMVADAVGVPLMFFMLHDACCHLSTLSGMKTCSRPAAVRLQDSLRPLRGQPLPPPCPRGHVRRLRTTGARPPQARGVCGRAARRVTGCRVHLTSAAGFCPSPDGPPGWLFFSTELVNIALMDSRVLPEQFLDDEDCFQDVAEPHHISRCEQSTSSRNCSCKPRPSIRTMLTSSQPPRRSGRCQMKAGC